MHIDQSTMAIEDRYNEVDLDYYKYVDPSAYIWVSNSRI
jgi:hypothetical protein